MKDEPKPEQWALVAAGRIFEYASRWNEGRRKWDDEDVAWIIQSEAAPVLDALADAVKPTPVLEWLERHYAKQSKWTKELPTVEGWYWMRFDAATYRNLPAELYVPKLVYVYRRHNGAMDYEDVVNAECYSVAEPRGYWAGPVVPPPIVITEDDKQPAE